jgi:hypothetical protein
MNTKLCLHCNADFIPVRSDAKFCSHSCRQMAYAERSNSNENIPVDHKMEVEINVNKNGTNKYLMSKFDACDASQPSIGEKNNYELPLIIRQEYEICVLDKESEQGKNRQKNQKNSGRKLRKKRECLHRINMQLDMISDRITITNTNFKLRGYIEKLFYYESKPEISRYDIEYFLQDIISFLAIEQRLPISYPHISFIKNKLIPKLNRVLNTADKDKVLTFKLNIPEEVKKELTDIINKLTDNF